MPLTGRARMNCFPARRARPPPPPRRATPTRCRASPSRPTAPCLPAAATTSKCGSGEPPAPPAMHGMRTQYWPPCHLGPVWHHVPQVEEDASLGSKPTTAHCRMYSLSVAHARVQRFNCACGRPGTHVDHGKPPVARCNSFVPATCLLLPSANAAACPTPTGSLPSRARVWPAWRATAPG